MEGLDFESDVDSLLVTFSVLDIDKVGKFVGGEGLIMALLFDFEGEPVIKAVCVSETSTVDINVGKEGDRVGDDVICELKEGDFMFEDAGIGAVGRVVGERDDASSIGSIFH